jgi:glycine/D-amino acid oxidase-like deaminating enzyme
MGKPKRIVVLGYGAAGAAIVHEIARRYDITVISGDFYQGSTATNQKWKHSGLLYHHSRLARQMWQAYQNMDEGIERPFIMKPQARFLALSHNTLQAKVDTWRRWGVRSWGLTVEQLASHEYKYAGLLGQTMAVGGFSTPDCVMDFPELIRNLRTAAENNGTKFIDGARAKRLRIEKGKITGVEYTTPGNDQEILPCDLCVVAMGAWANKFIGQHSGARPLPIILRKCLVLKYPGELVPCLTVCLDLREGVGSDAALVPFKGETIAAESLGVEAPDPDDRVIDDERVNCLRKEYARCFPELEAHEPCVMVCFKTEERTRTGAPNLDYKVYTDDAHGLLGVVVAIPGKASLMFQMASAVTQHLRDVKMRISQD